MKRGLAAIALGAAMVMSGCSESGPAEKTGAEAPTEAVAHAAPAKAAPAVASEPAQPAAPGAPAFAVIYPGGEPTKPATVAQGPAGPGGILEFTTEAAPEAVIAFYKHRAEAAGLKPISTMNRGAVSGYSAGDGAQGGRLMSVIVTAGEGEPTSVQLDWTNGR